MHVSKTWDRKCGKRDDSDLYRVRPDEISSEKDASKTVVKSDHTARCFYHTQNMRKSMKSSMDSNENDQKRKRGCTP